MADGGRVHQQCVYAETPKVRSIDRLAITFENRQIPLAGRGGPASHPVDELGGQRNVSVRRTENSSRNVVSSVSESGVTNKSLSRLPPALVMHLPNTSGTWISSPM